MNSPLIRLDLSESSTDITTFDDEDTSEAISYEISKRPLQSSFHNSRYNKKVYPSGFNLNLARSERFNEQDDIEDDLSGERETFHNSLNQFPNAASQLQSRQKTSFMFWAKGLPGSPAEFDNRKQMLPNTAGYGPQYAENCLKTSRSSSNNSSPQPPNHGFSSPLSPPEGFGGDATHWLEAQIHREIGMTAPHSGTQSNHNLHQSQNSRRVNATRPLRNNSNMFGSSSHQIPYQELEPATHRTHSRKISLNTPYTGFRPHNVKGPDLKEFIRYDDWALKIQEKDPTDSIELERLNLFRREVSQLENEHLQQITMKTMRVLPIHDFSPESSLFTNLLPDEGATLRGYGHPGSDSVCGSENNMTGSHCSSTDGGVRFGHSNITPLAGRVILMIYRYKSMMMSNTSTTFDKAALMLDIKADVKYSVIMKIIADFSLSSAKSTGNMQGSDTTQKLNLSLSNTIRNKVTEEKNLMKNLTENSSSEYSDIMRNPYVEVYYFHSVLNVWRVVKDETVWDFAVLLSLENDQPLRIMVSRGKKDEIKEMFATTPPQGMSRARMNILKNSVGDSKNLLSLVSEYNGDYQHQHQSSSKHISPFYDILDAQKQKKNVLLQDKVEFSPFIIAEKTKHNNPVIRIIKNRKIVDSTNMTENASDKTGNLIAMKSSMSLLPGSLKSKSAMNSKNLIPATAYSTPYSQVFASITTDSIGFTNSASLSLNSKSKSIVPMKVMTSALAAGPKIKNQPIIKSIKQEQLAESLKNNLMLTRW